MFYDVAWLWLSPLEAVVDTLSAYRHVAAKHLARLHTVLGPVATARAPHFLCNLLYYLDFEISLDKQFLEATVLLLDLSKPFDVIRTQLAKLLALRINRWSLTPWRLVTSETVSVSFSCKIRTICSSANLDLVVIAPVSRGPRL